MEGLRVVEDGAYLDGTFGRGGHARGVLQRLGSGGRLLLMDKDPEAIAVAEREFGADARVAIRRGSFAELGSWDVARAGLDRGVRCEFAPGSVIMGGGGMKGYKDAPDDWEDQIKAFFGIERMGNQYGFSECIGNAPLCEAGHFHLPPYSVPLLMGASGEALPREGIQKGRLVLVDLVPVVAPEHHVERVLGLVHRQQFALGAALAWSR